MTSQWDLPEARDAESPQASRHRHVPRGKTGWSSTAPEGGERRRDGFVDPVAFFGFLLRNILKIGLITILLTVIGVMLFRMIPFSYRATATVLVDPRSQQVTLQQDVLPPIGSDAAVLESMVLIMKSDSFLLGVLRRIDPNFEKLPQTEQLEELSLFKKNLSVERRGATYLVEITYKAETADEAARIANIVATSFADAQNGSMTEATQNAARALSQRLVDLRSKVNASEKAVADFAAAHNILYVDNNNTLQMRQLTELSAQLALARTATEEARARYQEQTQGGDLGVVLSSERSGEPTQLAFLRQQRTQLMQTMSQQSLTYGARHPRLAQTRELIAGIDRQILEEKATLARQLKGALDVAEAQQGKLEAEIARLTSGAVETDAAKVQLEALRREAAADREIYEQFLSRNKATDELAELKTDNVTVVSAAIPPLNSIRPSIVLVGPVLAFLSAAAATAFVVVADSVALPRSRTVIGRRRKQKAPDAPADEAPAAAPAPEALPQETVAETVAAPIAEPLPKPAAEPAPETAPVVAEEKSDWQRDWEELAARLDREKERRDTIRDALRAKGDDRLPSRIQPERSLLMRSEAALGRTDDNQPVRRPYR